jgi:hypothetical protein
MVVFNWDRSFQHKVYKWVIRFILGELSYNYYYCIKLICNSHISRSNTDVHGFSTTATQIIISQPPLATHSLLRTELNRYKDTACLQIVPLISWLSLMAHATQKNTHQNRLNIQYKKVENLVHEIHKLLN